MILGQDFIIETVCQDLSPYDYKPDDFQCYDKDGFDLTRLEQIIYLNNHFDLHHILNRNMLARPWMRDASLPDNIYIDHCVLFMRCSVEDRCKKQIEEWSKHDRRLIYLLQTKQKWGIDIDINWIDGYKAYEVIHLEYDSYELQEAVDLKIELEDYFNTADLSDMAAQIIAKESEWRNVNGLAQNDWKARYFGFTMSEITKKSF